MSSDTRERILYLLKTRGPQSAQFLAGELGITPVGARQHLKLLAGEGLEALIARREKETLQDYRRALAGCASLGGKVRKLVELRSGEGYMAEVVREKRGVWLLLENHCPICAAARKCRGFCRSELEIFRRCLDGARVERCEYLLEGARRCAYRITGTDN